MEFHEAWYWLCRHPAFVAKGAAGRRYPFARFTEALDIMVARVDPITRRIEDDTERNTHTEVWLECGPYNDPDEEGIKNNFYPDEWIQYGIPCHDINLDCGGDTFEEAIIKLADLVKLHHGDYAEPDGVD